VSERPHRAWWLLLALAAGLVSALEAAILEVRSGYFTSGYGGAQVGGASTLALFVGASLVLDVFLMLAAWSLCVPLLRRLLRSRLAAFALAGFVALWIPLTLDFARYVLEAILGRAVTLAALWELSGRSSLEMLAESAEQLPTVAWLAASGIAGAAAAVLGALALERRWQSAPRLEPPRLGALALGCAASALCGAAALGAPGRTLETVQFGVGKKPSAMLLRAAVERASDLDRDGAGWLSRPADPAPFDARIHAYALDVPGNGVDENGLGGDHPARFALAADSAPATLPAAAGPRPWVLLAFLETFRGDLVGQRSDGREITPFLNALAARGVSSQRAYAHTPHTFASRAQLFGGTLTPRAEQRTLLDDFAALGYEVAHFSGQDDSFADSARYLGSARADHFYDARQDIARHTGRGTSAGALQVSWKRVEERIAGFLESRQSDAPLFVYVNLVDTHFPFDHAELDPILSTERLDRAQIRESNRARVVAAYANSAANVDRGLERIAARLAERAPGELAIVVTADHGEALYEDGYLGHGQDLDDAQTRVPFIVAGLGGRWPEPLGVADVRGLLLRNLREPGPPRLEPEGGRRLFQYLSRIDVPRQIALRGADTLARHDFRSGAFAGEPDEREPLIWTWEALARRAADASEVQAHPSSGAPAHSAPETQAD
jgi:hypothetical protein